MRWSNPVYFQKLNISVLWFIFVYLCWYLPWCSAVQIIPCSWRLAQNQIEYLVWPLAQDRIKYLLWATGTEQDSVLWIPGRHRTRFCAVGDWHRIRVPRSDQTQIQHCRRLTPNLTHRHERYKINLKVKKWRCKYNIYNHQRISS